MKKALLALLPALLLAACVTQPVDKQADIAALYQAAGLDAEISWLQKPLNTHALAYGSMPMNETLTQAVNSAVAQTVDADSLRANVKSRLSGMSDADIRKAIAFFQSPAGRDVVAMEAGQEPAAYAGLDRDRLDAIDTATGNSQTLGLLAEPAVAQAIDMVSKKKCKNLGSMPVALFSGLIERAAMSAVRQHIRNGLYSRYERLSVADLQAYLDFAQSSAGQQFYQARNAAYGDVMTNAGKALGEDLAQLLSAACQS